MRTPPSKDMCFYMARVHWEANNHQLSWEYLICWGFYEMYVEGWWQE